MGRSFIGLTAVAMVAPVLQPAAAQNAQPAAFAQPWDAVLSALPYPVMAGRWTSAIAGPGNSGAAGAGAIGASTGEMPGTQTAAPAPAGLEVAPGTTFAPKAFSEIGYDSNPAGSLSGVKGSAFVRTGAGVNLSPASQSTSASLNAGGSFLNYFNDAALGDPRGYAGSASASVTYLVQPGVTVSSGGFINYDAESASRSLIDGASAELAYTGSLVGNSLRLSFKQVAYLSGEGAPNDPLALSSANDYNRSEITWLGSLGRDWIVSPYAEVSAARIAYTGLSGPDVPDRSADDYHAKAGLRVHLSPKLSVEAGWRGNERDTEDRSVGKYESSGYDGGLTWQPTLSFNLAAGTERYIGEPSTNAAVLADVRSYNVRANYLAVPGVTVSAAAGWQVATDIGSSAGYRMDYAGGQLAWDYNNRVQFYTTANYQIYDMKWQDCSYSDLRLATGVRIVPGAADLLHGESLGSLLNGLAN